LGQRKKNKKEKKLYRSVEILLSEFQVLPR